MACYSFEKAGSHFLRERVFESHRCRNMSIFCMFYKYFLFRNIFLQYKTTASSIGFLLTWYQCFAIDENLLHGGADTWRNNLLLFRGSKYETSIKFVNRVYSGECVISQNTSIGCIF